MKHDDRQIQWTYVFDNQRANEEDFDAPISRVRACTFQGGFSDLERLRAHKKYMIPIPQRTVVSRRLGTGWRCAGEVRRRTVLQENRAQGVLHLESLRVSDCSIRSEDGDDEDEGIEEEGEHDCRCVVLEVCQFDGRRMRVRDRWRTSAKYESISDGESGGAELLVSAVVKKTYEIPAGE